MMKPKKILVADDDAGIVEAIKILLEDEGYDVLATMNGENIISLCKEKPDMILLDIWMSGSNGNVVCKEIKSNPATSHIPVILFSANRNTRQISMECGADGFLSKPFEIENLLRLAQKHTA